MRHFLLLLSFIIFTGSAVFAQDFRFERPMSDSIALNGSFLFGETNNAGTTQTGVEFQADIDDTVFAAHDGRVGIIDEATTGFGTSVTLDGMWEDEKVNTFYGHLSSTLIDEEDSVAAGDPIALAGTTGDIDDPLMHFEIRVGWHSNEDDINGSRVNPELWFAMEGTGAIVGTIPNAENSTVVDINNDPKPRPPYTTYTYSLTYDFAEPLIGNDDVYEENFAIGDVWPGSYTITSGDFSADVTVEAGKLVSTDGPFTSVEENTEIAKEIKLNQNYPNPFNPSTVISFSIPENSHVNLAVFDITGKQVSELTNGRMAAGSHEVNFNASGLSSGIYFYKLMVNNQIFTRKLTLLK